ncbi:hypothetical protein [Candidatus Poriferisocius sp.]|uniref:hypothetical protein n=1 Tax=Candidatus Poriferisocius sp. TaxID=3101276 RepID=UPI003B016E54
MVNRLNREQWSPASWPVALRWRLLAAAVVLVVTIAAIAALSRDGQDMAEVSVVAAAQRWAEGHPPGDHATVDMPADLAALFVLPAELADAIAAVDVPEGTLVSPRMLRPRQSGDANRTTALMRFMVSAEMWGGSGPAGGDRAVFSPSSGGCAAALVTLIAVDDDGAATSVTIEATPELASVLSDGQWWIWESPPGGWPPCHSTGAPEADGAIS